MRPLLLPIRAAAGLLLAAALALFCPTAQAHVGSPNVFFEGPAGPYPVRVTIQPPGVVPGLAQIHVRIRSGDVQKVTVLPVRWNAGTRGAPPPDTATPVPGETNLFTAQLWLMDSGAYSVFVDVSGPQGRGTAIVPLNSVAYQRLGMSRGMGIMFLCLGSFLVILLTTVVGAAIRESSLPAGAGPDTRRKRLAMLAMVLTLGIAVFAVWFGNRWWGTVDQAYLSRRLYQPQKITPTLERDTNGQAQLVLDVAPTRPIESTPLVPDHGHLMHLFLVRQPQGDVFAHLHPLRDPAQKGDVFKAALPSLPGGDYLLYADVTHESGFTQTLTNLVRLAEPADPTNSTAVLLDADDAVDFDAPQFSAARTLEGNFHLAPSFGETVKANDETTLRFDLTTDSGQPAPLEPYLGMYGHLIIQRDDGGVFAHLHPLGTISMEAQRRFAEREHAGYLANQPLDLLCSPASTTLAFPYAFPEPGKYRLWLQTRLQGRIRTIGYLINVQ